jgi:hypothetical protein
MGDIRSQSVARAKKYVERQGIEMTKRLGFGVQGDVYSTTRMSAIKAFDRVEHYRRERDVYLRIEEQGFRNPAGFNVPRLINFDDDLWIVEMGVVKPPYVVDFAGAYLDHPPPFSEDELSEWEADRIELFGDDWDQVKLVMAAFRRIKVYLNDVKPGNVTVRDE